MKYILILLAVVVAPFTLFADSRGDEALAELSQRMRELGDYQSSITLKVQSDIVEGEYHISGSNYHIDLGNVEFWGIGDKRYEVSHKIEEVVIERADSAENTLLSNPNRAFDLVGQGFDAEIIADNSAEGLRLTPNSKNNTQIDVDQIVIYLDSKSKLPSKIIYRADGESVEIEFGGIKKSKSSITLHHHAQYRHLQRD